MISECTLSEENDYYLNDNKSFNINEIIQTLVDSYYKNNIVKYTNILSSINIHGYNLIINEKNYPSEYNDLEKYNGRSLIDFLLDKDAYRYIIVFLDNCKYGSYNINDEIFSKVKNLSSENYINLMKYTLFLLDSDKKIDGK